jgi:hypothetical protein
MTITGLSHKITDSPDQAGTFVHANMRLVAVDRARPARALGKASIRIDRSRVPRRPRSRPRLDQGRIQHRATLQDHTGFLQLPVQLREQLFQPLLADQQIAEPA